MIGYIDYIKHARKIFYKRNVFPEQVTFFTTNKCNANCKHCFAWKELNTTERMDLTIDEIEKISSSMDEFIYLLLGGGEPFLREDIAEIVRIFYRNNNVLNVAISTNGASPQRIVDQVRRILGFYKNSLTINISFDGIGEEHDEIRGRKGIFEQAVSTHNALKELKRSFSRLNVGIIITCTPFNQTSLKYTYNWLKEHLNPYSIVINFMRGDIRVPKDSYSPVNISYYDDVSKLIERDNFLRKVGGHHNFFLSDFNIASKMLMRETVSKTIKQNRFQTRCYAGLLNCVLSNDGTVFPCEMLDKDLGYLRESGYDFSRIWFSQKADDVRKFIKESKCYCTEECNINMNILFNPKSFPLLLARVLKIKTASFLQGRKWVV